MENQKEMQTVFSLDEVTVIIKSELENISGGFISVGYYLKRTRDERLYLQKGYESLFDYAKDTFGISRFTAVRFMEINDKYSIGGYSPQIEERWKGYGSSKLTEMLGLPEEILEEVPREATVADIREVKRTIRETKSKYDAQYELCDVAQETLEDSEDWLVKLVKHYFLHEGRESFREFVLWLKSNHTITGWSVELDVLEMVNPSKFKMLRLDTANVLMQESGLRVMPYRDRGEKAEYTYLDFARTFERIFYPDYPDMGKSAEEVYQEVYGEPLRKKEEPPKPESKTEPFKAGKKTEKKEEEKKPRDLGNTKSGDDLREGLEQEEIPGQMELTRDMPEYNPEGMEEESRERQEAPEEGKEEIQEGRVVADILTSGSEELIMRLLAKEFAEPAAGWGTWKRKVVTLHE